jgi:hypothetical protein
MRALPLLAAALTLAACGNNGQKDLGQNADESMTAENIVSNDVTAIDAVTGDAANMAADVDMNYGNLDQSLDTTAPSGEAAPKARPSTPRASSSKATAEPAANSAANTATNAE